MQIFKNKKKSYANIKQWSDQAKQQNYRRHNSLHSIQLSNKNDDSKVMTTSKYFINMPCRLIELY